MPAPEHFAYDLQDRWIIEANSAGTACNFEIYAGARHLLSGYDGDSLFDHTDWLGTSRLRRDLTYGTNQKCTSLPFGDGESCRGGEGSSPLLFTGKERDNETGLDNFGARFNSSSFGRFLSPDEPLNDQDQSDPQSWNLYSYVRNNPLNSTDPDGHDCVYLNDAGDGVQEIDHNSSSTECSRTGGFWANGTVEKASWVTTLPNSDDVHIWSHYKDVVGETWAGPGYSNGDSNANIIPFLHAREESIWTGYALSIYLTGPVSGLSPEEEDEGQVAARYPVGRRRSNMYVGSGEENGPPTNAPATILGREYSGHALDRMQGRGLTPTVVEEIIASGTESAGTEPGTTMHSAQGITVITNQTGRVVTVMYSR
ncbi:MAG TPA: RHS repeat-associated core domain-containing protein [Candidatus Acidoferrum sp.]|nr:RHS repeat-associated core domain-containing protein [Candidatus Acidoferrum sp.]